MATNRQWTPADGGERQEEAEFHRIVSWAKLAEICSQILYKGRKVYVEGRLQTRNWTGQDGQERQTTEVVIDSMIALGPPKTGAAEGVEDFGGDSAKTTVQPTSSAAIDDSSQTADKDEMEGEKKDEVKEEKKEAVDEKSKRSEPEKKEEKTKVSGKKKKEVSEDDIPF
jgi:single-strand DNA-binding protein